MLLDDMMPSDETSIIIQPGYLSPASIEGNSCVYILQINNPCYDQDSMSSANGYKCDNRKNLIQHQSYYVGETDSISKRLAQHRQTYGKSNLTVAVLCVGDKSVARDLESRLIRKMAQSGLFRMIKV